MQKDEDHVNVHGVCSAYKMVLQSTVGDMGSGINVILTLILKKFYEISMTILVFLAEVAMWVQSIADESSTLVPFVMPCWPGGSDYGPPEVEIDDTRRSRDRTRKQLKIKESLNVKSYVTSTTCGHHHCTICLSEFCDNEIVYELPKCKHIFHKPCLNQWLRRHRTTCPICRSSLQPPLSADTRITARHAHQL